MAFVSLRDKIERFFHSFIKDLVYRNTDIQCHEFGVAWMLMFLSVPPGDAVLGQSLLGVGTVIL